MKIEANMKTLEIRKPLYNNFVYIRESILKSTDKLKVKIPNGEAVINTEEWIKSGKRMEKVFKIPNCPMILFGNYLPINEKAQTLL